MARVDATAYHPRPSVRPVSERARRGPGTGRPVGSVRWSRRCPARGGACPYSSAGPSQVVPLTPGDGEDRPVHPSARLRRGMRVPPGPRVERDGLEAHIARWFDRQCRAAGHVRQGTGVHDVRSPQRGHTNAPSATRSATTRIPVRQDAGSKDHVRSRSTDRGPPSSVRPACCGWVGALHGNGTSSRAVPVASVGPACGRPERSWW